MIVFSLSVNILNNNYFKLLVPYSFHRIDNGERFFIWFMTLHQLEVFAKVAKLRSFTQAGESLRIRQPSVTLLIKGLERELEVKLFEKLGNKVHLTGAGERLLQDAEEILAKVEGIKEGMDELKGLKKGRLTVGGSFTAAASFLTIAVQRFKKGYPGVDVTLKIQRSKTLERNLLDGELHLAIMGWTPHSPLLATEPYREEEIVVIARPDHPLTKKRSVPLELIAKEAFITNEKGTPIREMAERTFAERGLPFSVALEVDVQFGSRDAIKTAVASGLGIGLSFMCHVTWNVKAGHLKVLKVPELRLNRTLYIVIHKKWQGSPLVQAFIDFLRQYKD